MVSSAIAGIAFVLSLERRRATRARRDREPDEVDLEMEEAAPADADPGRLTFPSRPASLPAVEIVGLGVDICEIARMERALARHPTMRSRVFTPEEIAYCDAKARPAESYAGRFAAREAVIKALGGYRGRRWQDISVTRHRRARRRSCSPGTPNAGRTRSASRAC